MQITHEEARRLIHFQADHSLDQKSLFDLQSHIRDCVDCNNFASQIFETEKTLKTLLNRKWNQLPLPHNRQIIMAKVKSKRWHLNPVLPTRSLLISIFALCFGFVLWQFGISTNNTNSGTSVTTSSIPTPSISLHYTSTQTSTEGCDVTTRYVVQENEDLKAIANHFSVSEASILKINDLTSKEIVRGMQLKIPACTETPTGTSGTPIFTSTPLQQGTTNTPG